MQLPRSRNKYATKRANSLRTTGKPIIGPVQHQRSGITVPIKPKNGYDLLPDNKSVYTYSTLQDLRNRFIRLCVAKRLKPSKKHIDNETIFELERLMHHVYMDKSETDDFRLIYEAIDCFDAGLYHGEFQRFNGQPVMAIHYTYKQESPGCFILRHIFRRPNKRVIYALALMEHFLNVYAWYNLEIKEHVETVIEYFGSGWYVENGEQGEPINHTNWRNKSMDMDLYSMQQSVNLSKIAKLEKEWEWSGTDVAKAFKRALLDTSMKRVAQWLTIKDDSSLFLKAVIYLVVNGFNMHDYIPYEDEEQYSVPIQESYAMLWDDDDYLAVLDEHFNNSYEGGLCSIGYTELYFEKGCLRPAGNNHLELIRIFAQLYTFNLKTRKFNDQENERIQACFTALHLPQWERLLHRAISNLSGKLRNRMETDERRVYP